MKGLNFGRVLIIACLLIFSGSWWLPSARADSNHTTDYGFLDNAQKTASDFFQIAGADGLACGPNTYRQDPATTAYRLVAGHQYILTYGAQIPSGTVTVEVIGSISGILWHDSLTNTGPGLLSLIASGTNAAVTTYGTSAGGGVYDAVFFTATNADAITFTCSGVGGSGMHNRWTPVMGSFEDSRIVATFENTVSTGTCPFVNSTASPQCFGALFDVSRAPNVGQITVRGCGLNMLDTAGTCHEDLGPVFGVSVQFGAPNQGVPTQSNTTDANGHTTFYYTYPVAPFGVQFQIAVAKNGYLPQNWTAFSFGNVTSVIYIPLSPQGAEVAYVPVNVTFNVTNPTFVSGQLVQVMINRTRAEDLWVILFILDSLGNPLPAGGFTPYNWTPSQPNTLNVSWPDGRFLNDADSGGYVLGVFLPPSSINGTLLAFDPIGVNQAAPNVGTSLLTNLAVVGIAAIVNQAQTLAATATRGISEATVQQHFLEWLDWFPRTDLFLPNAILLPVLFFAGALLLRFAPRSRA